ncbi:chromate efflux transporter [Sulfurimonas autotrophica]|uniref:Chromate transporter, chromate ion transporter (CHR) family n=1 Tax=Sulfurimonas autotrophica (strain ATCC BAA-671 / DSM 16294 / JCM 11897 / OK10) TaxID=563040 RepID=E0UP92_SULAO|nr:chromate efflux transporter [Sulfurimonas autotrophica]ADN08556.1 chromate transporter, chromate ion transporter (CHR) family [Sulfurimonas autotrophica DSM 16294]
MNAEKESKLQTTPSLLQLSWAFLIIGLTAYSVAMLQQLKTLVVGRKWLSQKEMDEGLAMVQLYPGPIMFNLATYSAYRIKGFWGALIATFLFVLPSYLLMLFLSWLYFNYGNVAWVHPLFIVLEAMVVGIIIHVSLDFATRYIDDGKTAFIAGIAFVLMLYKINAFWVILLAVVVGTMLFWRDKMNIDSEKNEQIQSVPIPGLWQWRLVSIVLSGSVFLAMIVLGLLWKNELSLLFLSMFKVGAVAFGNGMTIMPLLQQEAVISHHWLSMKQFADGIAFGQITPGPFLITATFIGYKVSGLIGSLLATVGMFYPSFFYTIVMSELYSKIKKYLFIRKVIKGILAAFTGMLFFVVLSMGTVSLISPSVYIWAIGALIAVRYYEMNILWIFLTGIAVELGLFLTGISIL